MTSDIQKEIEKLEVKYGNLSFLVKSRLNPSKIPTYIKAAKKASLKVDGTISIVSALVSLFSLLGYYRDFPQEVLFILPISLYMLIFSYKSYILDKRAISELSDISTYGTECELG